RSPELRVLSPPSSSPMRSAWLLRSGSRGHPLTPRFRRPSPPLSPLEHARHVVFVSRLLMRTSSAPCVSVQSPLYPPTPPSSTPITPSACHDGVGQGVTP